MFVGSICRAIQNERSSGTHAAPDPVFDGFPLFLVGVAYPKRWRKNGHRDCLHRYLPWTVDLAWREVSRTEQVFGRIRIRGGSYRVECHPPSHLFFAEGDFRGQHVPLLSSNRSIVHASGYIAAQRHIVEFTNYEAHMSFFPTRFRPDRDPYIHIGPLESLPQLLYFLSYPRKRAEGLNMYSCGKRIGRLPPGGG